MEVAREHDPGSPGPSPIARVSSGGTAVIAGHGGAPASPYGAASSNRSPGPAGSRAADETANTLDVFQQMNEPKQTGDSPR
jgi:hypothetical protein